MSDDLTLDMHVKVSLDALPGLKTYFQELVNAVAPVDIPQEYGRNPEKAIGLKDCWAEKTSEVYDNTGHTWQLWNKQGGNWPNNYDFIVTNDEQEVRYAVAQQQLTRELEAILDNNTDKVRSQIAKTVKSEDNFIILDAYLSHF